ncbi:MAG: hypothetical protein H7Y07_18355 [Pyrinomonadaceae bacterium]|nr:hypothetical protein [Sphingobacteriaceae bacterium]
MKKGLFLLILAVGSCQYHYSLGQSTRYQKISDNPDDAINTMISILPIDSYMAMGKYSGLSVCLGASGAYGLTSRLGFEGNAATSYISIKPGGFTQFEGGAFLNFKMREKVKNTRVILSYSRTSTSTSTTYIEVPAKVKIATGLRGGIHYSSAGIESDGIKITAGNSKLNLAGIYAGIQSTNKHLIKTQQKDEKEPRPTGALFKLYADMLFFPVSKISDPVLDSKIASGNLGGRAGILWVVAPYTKKQHPNYKAFLHRLNIISEIGSKPVDGLYVKMGAGWGLFYK